MNARRHPYSGAIACLVCAALVAAGAPVMAQKTEKSSEQVSIALQDSSAGVQELFPQYRLIGKSRLTFWGIQVYDANLWATPTFKANNLSSQAFALELIYLRDFESKKIAEKSISEMRRSATITDAQAKAWTLELMRVIPDVKKGDRVLGENRPDVGAVFRVNGQLSGEIRDVEFARLFFGIWLSPQTSEPAMRSALMAGAL